MDTWKFSDVFPIIFGYGTTDKPDLPVDPGDKVDPDDPFNPWDPENPGGDDNPGGNDNPGENDNPGNNDPDDDDPNENDPGNTEGSIIKKIRLGNDVRLKIQLALTESTDHANIQHLRAIFVNSTLKEKLRKEYKKKNRFFSRFPHEPFMDEYCPSEYNINCSGYPRYKAIVANQYNGFGVYPDWKKCSPVKEMPITEYQSEVTSTVDRRVVSLLFPAEAQMYEGVYDLIVTARINAPGFKGNTRTVTADYKNLFELVRDSETGIDSPVQIEINNNADENPLEDVYVVAGSYTDDNIKLKRNDRGVVNIDVSPITSWYEGE